MLLFYFLGCQGECPNLEGLGSEQATFNLDATDFSADSTWMMTGTAMQVNITATEGTSITLRLQKSDAGSSAADLATPTSLIVIVSP